MTDLYCIIDNSDDQLDVSIKKLPVVEVIDTPAKIPGSPPDGLPAKEAYVADGAETHRVVLGVNASDDPNIALRLAFRVIDRYVSDDMLHVLELHRNRTALDQDRLTLKSASEALIATLREASEHVHKLVCSVLEN